MGQVSKHLPYTKCFILSLSVSLISFFIFYFSSFSFVFGSSSPGLWSLVFSSVWLLADVVVFLRGLCDFANTIGMGRVAGCLIKYMYS